LGGSASQLDLILSEELDRPAGEPAGILADEIRRRYGAGVAAILFYGSCLRRGSAEGVLDFYVLVDSYRAVHGSSVQALLGALLPPNVLYCESGAGESTLRAKCAVMTLEDFARAASRRSLDSRVWARFCQPAVLAWVRDEETRREVIDAVACATRTMVDRMRAWGPSTDAVQRVPAVELWTAAFRETYRAELRSERPEVVEALAAGDPARYQRVIREAMRDLECAGRVHVRAAGVMLELEYPRGARTRARLAWRVRRPLAKTRAVLGLVKTAATFDDWVSYVLWKLERQSGERIQVSEAQRRHPLLLGWPILFRLLRRGVLR
jgi:hypothetical protein